MAAEPVIVADDDDWEMETRVDNELGSAAFADLIRVRLLVPSVLYKAASARGVSTG
jgi:hypothetical protein